MNGMDADQCCGGRDGNDRNQGREKKKWGGKRGKMVDGRGHSPVAGRNKWRRGKGPAKSSQSKKNDRAEDESVNESDGNR